MTSNALPALREVLGIWAAVALLAVSVLVTYSRIPVDQLYNVSLGGVGGGFSRVITYLNYPGAFVAIALLGVVMARLSTAPSALSAAGRRAASLTAIVAFVLCLITALPGVVKESHLDARPINAFPVLGVALTAGLTILAARRTGPGRRAKWTRGDWFRLGVMVVFGCLAIPWMLAELGFYAGDVPLLKEAFMSKQMLPGATLPAVHLGDHHGLDGTLFASSAIFLSRQLGRIRSRWLRVPLAYYFGLMIAYGLGNMANDWSLEQLVKRGTIAHETPSVIEPGLTPAWGVIVVAAIVIGSLFLLAARRQEATGD